MPKGQFYRCEGTSTGGGGFGAKGSNQLFYGMASGTQSRAKSLVFIDVREPNRDQNLSFYIVDSSVTFDMKCGSKIALVSRPRHAVLLLRNCRFGVVLCVMEESIGFSMVSGRQDATTLFPNRHFMDVKVPKPYRNFSFLVGSSVTF